MVYSACLHIPCLPVTHAIRKNSIERLLYSNKTPDQVFTLAVYNACWCVASGAKVITTYDNCCEISMSPSYKLSRILKHLYLLWFVHRL